MTAVLERARAELPFDDTRDLDEQKRGLIAPMAAAEPVRAAWTLFQSFGSDDESTQRRHLVETPRARRGALLRAACQPWFGPSS